MFILMQGTRHKDHYDSNSDGDHSFRETKFTLKDVIHHLIVTNSDEHLKQGVYL